ncbi:MAG: O-antigen ligase family protein [Defluviitaleaceae bacterium]|nr:O-antigen ligase family protein [Defluviitaleaceae bacterium]
MKDKISGWISGSVILRAVIWLFNAFLAVCRGSFIIGLFSIDYDNARLKRSLFIRLVEGGLNFVPKIDGQAEGRVSHSVIVRLLTADLDNPLPQTNTFKNWAKWFFAGLPVWGMVFIIVGAAFMPTMIFGGLLAGILLLAIFRFRFELDLAGAALVFFMLISLVAGFVSLSRETSLFIALLMIILAFSYLLIRACFQSVKALDVALWGFVVSGGLTGLVALYQWLVGYTADDAWVDIAQRADVPFRATSTFGNPNVYGTFLVLVIPIGVALIFYAKHLMLKLCAIGIVGLLMIALGLTFSRGSYLAVAVGIALFLLILEKRLIIAYVGGVFVSPFILPPAILSRFLSILDFSDTSTMYRFAIYRGTLRLIGDFWMFGIGQGMDAYNRAAPLHSLAGVYAAHSHNLFLQVFLETGIVGFITFMSVLILFFHRQFSFMGRVADSRRRILSGAFVSAVVGFLVMGLFDFPFHNYSIMLAFFLVLGLGSAVTWVKE